MTGYKLKIMMGKTAQFAQVLRGCNCRLQTKTGPSLARPTLMTNSECVGGAPVAVRQNAG